MHSLQDTWWICGLGSPLLTSMLLYIVCIFYFIWASACGDATRANAYRGIGWGLFGWATFLWVGFGSFTMLPK